MAASTASQPTQVEILAARAKHIPGLLARVREVNNARGETSKMVPLIIDGQTLGHLRPSLVDKLGAFKDVFAVHSGDAGGAGRLSLTAALEAASLEQRSQAVAGVLQHLRDSGVIGGWRDETYPVSTSFHAPPSLLIERAAAPHFGIRAYGVHVNGFVDGPEGTHLWVGRRSAGKSTWPGLLDHIAAGGQPFGLSCAENVVKECGEEAGIPPTLAAQAVPVGLVSYVSMVKEGVKPDVLFCYDLQLPSDFVPSPLDGEVSEFMLWDLERVAAAMSSPDTHYKPNCCIVIIDFLVRRGWLTPDMPGYAQLVAELRQGQPA